jgi:hypothetical protein
MPSPRTASLQYDGMVIAFPGFIPFGVEPGPRGEIPMNVPIFFYISPELIFFVGVSSCR